MRAFGQINRKEISSVPGVPLLPQRGKAGCQCWSASTSRHSPPPLVGEGRDGAGNNIKKARWTSCEARVGWGERERTPTPSPLSDKKIIVCLCRPIRCQPSLTDVAMYRTTFSPCAPVSHKPSSQMLGFASSPKPTRAGKMIPGWRFTCPGYTCCTGYS